ADAAERIRAAISMLSIPLENGERLGCTVSVGHAQASGKAAQWRNLVADADGALYRAKNSGRNTVVDAALCQPEPVTTQTAGAAVPHVDQAVWG
ncbi:GGDEF domain-containing protein, partial [Tenacibaculum discolor]